MNKTITTIIVATLLATTLAVVRHIDNLNDGIKLKQIELIDNSAKLKILDQKYQKLNTELDQTGADKAKTEQQLKELEKQRDDLQRQLQAKIQAKQRIAITGTASAATCGSDPYMAYIYQHESGCNVSAVNSIGCRGIGQRCGNLPCGADFACQDAWFRNYAIVRYGSTYAAYQFWLSHSWW